MDLNFKDAMRHLGDLTKFGMNLGLSRMERLLGFLGNPQQGLKCIHVAGTNGKGSTSAMIASILQESGYRVGLFTSPHLERYTERIQINQQEISENAVAEGISLLLPLAEQVGLEVGPPTEFEVTTALASWYFAREQVDWAIFEVGLGGDQDSTNLITPRVTIITNVSLDHTDVLGSDIESIAAAKAGIIKAGVPVVTAAQGIALRVIEQRAGKLGSPLIRVMPTSESDNPGKSVYWNWVGTEGMNQPYTVVNGRLGNYPGLVLPLMGRHQGANAAAAIAAIEVLIDQGIAINRQAVARGLANTSWPGRMELIRADPPVIVDGAHNLAGANSLQEALIDYYPGYQWHLVLGVLQDKDRQGIARILAERAKTVIITPPPNPRAGDMQELVEECTRFCSETYYEPDNCTAIARGLEQVELGGMTGEKHLLCVTGSLFLIGPARSLLSALLENPEGTFQCK